MSKIKPLIYTLVFFSIFLNGCATISGNTAAEKRQSILTMKNQTLKKLYKAWPEAKAQLKKSPGYAVFSNANVNIIFASFGGGYGVVTDNKTNKHTYMKMGEVGIGIGLGAKDFRSIFIFKDRSTMQKFINTGWEFGGHADAAAKAGDKGAAIGGEVLIDKLTIYQLTESGLALQVTIKGTKYWKDDELN